MGNEEVDIISVAEKPKKKTLLETYNIPIDHLSYEFISQCSNGKTLERIVLILRSGEEGIYPDLTKHAEERLFKIKSTSAILRRAEPILRRNMLNAIESRKIDDDINNWTYEMQSCEKDLDEGKTNLMDDPYSQPEIRKQNVVKDKKTRINEKNEKKRDKPKRISSCDYAAWDKYDVDTEINKMDLQDERRQVEMKRMQERRKELDKTNIMAHKTAIDKLSLTSTEVNVMAVQEKEKGNEAFRAADYKEALRHYNASIEMDSNLNAYNNRAMTLIKLQHYEDALNDCNMVLSMDYRNVKALLRRALSLEHLEKAHEALADYEAVLKLEPNNKTAISSVKKLRKLYESRKIRMEIEEENISDDKVKAEKIKSERTVEMSNTEWPKQRANSDICYCNRAPGTSRSVATEPHLKASYCMETESDKLTVADTISNKSKRKTTRDSSSGNKLSPVAKDFGERNKTSRSQNAVKSDDIFMISRGSFPRSHGIRGSLEKSIFSCVSSPHKSKSSSVIIEELPSDEVCEKSKDIVPFNEAKVRVKKETNLAKEKNASIKKSCTNKNEKIIFPGKENKINLTPNKIQIVDECENPKKIIDSNNKTRMKIKQESNCKEDKEALIKKLDMNKNKKLTSPGKESKTNTHSTSNKIRVANECPKQSDKLEIDLQELENVASPYEFLRLWQSLKDNPNLEWHAKLLRSVAHKDMNKVIGNKLDAAMFGLILRCLEQQFCTPKDTVLLANLLYSLSQLNRFSIICMFMDSMDKKALRNILSFLEKEGSSRILQLRQIYAT